MREGQKAGTYETLLGDGNLSRVPKECVTDGVPHKFFYKIPEELLWHS